MTETRAGLDRLWAGWRIPYIEETAAAGSSKQSPHEPTRPDTDSGTLPEAAEQADTRSLFERIEQSGLPDETTHVLWRGDHCFALLNAYPYSSGHLMVLPLAARRSLGELSEAEHGELWFGVRCGVAALESAYSPHGVNVGINMGAAAGAGVPDHLHVHVLPRWPGDTNFMTSVAETRVLPESLDRTWSRLSAAWPTVPPVS